MNSQIWNVDLLPQEWIKQMLKTTIIGASAAATQEQNFPR